MSEATGVAKKRAKPVTMTKRSMDYLRKKGFKVAVVERTMWFPERRNGVPTGKNIMQKFDCFGFADILAVHRELPGTLYVQTTSRDNQAARRTKILGCEAIYDILRSGNQIVVHGWSKVGGRGERKLWEVSVYTLTVGKAGPVWSESVDQVAEDGEEPKTLFTSPVEEEF